MPGNPKSEWDITGAGDPTIQGFATDISVNRGGTVRFKVDTPASAWRLDIYRLGYYGGMGARKVATVLPSVSLPQFQPDCLNDFATGLIDCGNWAVSASWNVPSSAVSGVYIARAVRTDTGGASHIVFVVRDDSGHSDLLFQTSDTTWQAYNDYGGNSLYQGAPVGRAYKVSYNRPIISRAGIGYSGWLLWGEYPMIRWLEANGYDVSYTTGVDSDRRGAEILEHKVFLSVGHDEYWSGTQRANVEAARDAGVDLAFFSGNSVFWKTRWEPSIDGSGTQYRTLVSYKETHANARIDPTGEWTGTWRDPRFSPPADGGRPENALLGALFTVNRGPGGEFGTAIQVPSRFAPLRFWRNTSVASLAPGQKATLTDHTLGFEWGEDVENGFRPAGLIDLSSTVEAVPEGLLDYGSTYGPKTAEHSLVLHKAASGALVFDASSVQWSWGLDSTHDGPSTPTDVRIRQATVNLLADMGVQPATLQSGLVPAVASSDVTPPIATITSPSSGAQVPMAATVISGTASDIGGTVAGIEVSTDGGVTWFKAQPGSTGYDHWTYSWTPSSTGGHVLVVRATDDSANLQTALSTITVSVTGPSCPCSFWTQSETPTVPSSGETAGIEVGIRFTPSVSGVITGVRFYKGAGNTGTHVGHLWTASGALLASATYTGETSSGWQSVTFPTPVAVTAGTTYVASTYLPNGNYPLDQQYFTSPLVRGPLTAPAGTNGVYTYGPSSAFPAQSWNSSNYWVDVVFATGQAPPDTTPPTVTGTNPASGATGVSVTGSISASFSEAMNASTVSGSTVTLRNDSNQLVAATVTYNESTRTAVLSPTQALTPGTTYTARVSSGVTDLAGNSLASDVTFTFTTAAGAGCPCSFWDDSVVPAPVFHDPTPFELGVRFRASVSGQITGIRFYKGTANTGTHRANLWSSSGTLLATALFTNETPSGWQQVLFSTPVSVTAGTVYVASYFAPNGNDIWQTGFFNTQFTRGPLTAPAASNGGNGVFKFGAGFPADTWEQANFWVDVIFTTGGGATDTTPPTVTSTSPAAGATGVAVGSNVTVTFSEAMLASSITGSTVTLRDAGGQAVPATVTYNSTNRTATLDPSSNLTGGATYTARVIGGSSGVKDAAGNALASDVTFAFTTAGAPPDTTPPTITSTTPASGASGVAVSANIQVTFSEAMLTSSITTSTISLRNASNQQVSAAVSYNATTRTATLDPTANLTGGASYTVRILGGSSGVKDAAGNALAATVTVPFTTASSACPCSFWDDSVTPALAVFDPSPYELGVRFTPSQSGQITAIRFYKDSTNTGTHVANLWTNNGTLLSSAVFANETSSGWQQVQLPSPVPVTAGTTYVASYHVPNGNSTFQAGFFSSAFTRGPLTAPAASNGGNGVFKFGASGFPAETWEQANFWVDVVFEQAAADTTAPTVVSRTPSPGATSVAVTSNVTAAFSESLDPATVSSSTVTLRNASNQLVSASLSWDPASSQIVLDPASNLAFGVTYTARIAGGSSGVKDLAGNALASDVTWTFTTQAAGACPCSLWNPQTTVPTTPDSGDPEALELGVRFTSSMSGYIAGIRYYKSAANTGQHVGHLWSSNGTLLASATFTGETTSGWQEVLFESPVPVTAGTVYVASYYAPNGHYATHQTYFSVARTNGPLTAPATSSGGNGVFTYGPSAFPSSTWNGSNYWVDVIFVTQP